MGPVEALAVAVMVFLLLGLLTYSFLTMALVVRIMVASR